MKKIRMIVSGAIVLAVVGSAIAFKVPSLKLYTCNDAINKCQLFSNSNYQEVVSGGIIILKGALSSSNLVNKPCPGNCDQQIQVIVEQ